MALITEQRLEASRFIPFATPQTEVRPGKCIVLASVKIALGQRMRVRWFGMSVPRIYSGNAASLVKRNPWFTTAFAGVYSGDFEGIDEPCGMPLAWVGVDGAGFVATNPHARADFSQPDIYSMVLVNNTTEAILDCVVTGSVQIFD